MSPGSKRTSEKNKTSLNSAFILVSATALVLAVVLIVVGRLAAAPTVAANPIDKPFTTTPVKTTPPAQVTTISTTGTTKPVTTSTGTPTAATTKPSTTLPTAIATLPSANFSKGSPNAKVIMIEYTDFQCSHCQIFALTVEKELEAAYVDTGKVLLIYKFIAGFGEESWQANLAAATAGEQGQFWPYFDLLMQLRASPSVQGDLSAEKLTALAQQLGLDMPKFSDSLLSKKYAAFIDQQDAEARALGVNSTPTFFINGIKQAGAAKLEDLQKIIDPLLAEQAK